MEVQVTKDELWPYFIADNEEKYFRKNAAYAPIIEVDDLMWARWQFIQTEFFAMQDQLEELFLEARKL